MSETTPRAKSAQIQTVARYDFIVTFEPRPDEESFYEKIELELLETLRSAILRGFSQEVQSIFENMIDVRLERLERGSILGTVVLTLATGVSLYGFIAQYHDFYESLVLLRQQLYSLIHQVLRRRFGAEGPYLYTVHVTLTRVPIYKSTSPTQFERRNLPPFYSTAFFWYLLIMNLILMGVISVMVYRAIAIVYLRAP